MKHSSMVVFLAAVNVAACGGSSEGGLGGSGGADSGATDGGAGASGSAGTDGGGAAGQGASGASGSAGAAATGGSGPDVPLEDLPELYADVYCDVLENCSGAAAQIYDLVFPTDCRTYLERTYADAGFSVLDDAVNSGSVIYDGTRVNACLDAIRGRSCSELNDRSPAECEQALAGTVTEGADCTLDAECIGADLYCKIGASCPGTCSKLEAANGACQDDDHCESGLQCEDDVCVRPAAAGQPCGGGVAPPCTPGLLCTGDDDMMALPGMCSDPAVVFVGAATDACDLEANLCQPGLHCAVTGFAMGTVTAECRPTASAGGICNLALFAMCPSGQYCPLTQQQLGMGQFTASCTDLPAAGQACAPAIGARQCEEGARCVMGTCRTIQRLDGPCTADDECYSQTCDGTQCIIPNPCP